MLEDEDDEKILALVDFPQEPLVSKRIDQFKG
jgi:hypothetical protein